MTTTRRRRWPIVLAVVLAGLVIVGVGLILAFQDRATPVSEEQVAATLTVAPGSGDAGDADLYAYVTTGYETTDALGGARHDMPAETYLSIRPGGCGFLVRWDALEQRWNEWDICPDGSLAGWTSYHQWYGVSNTDNWVCPEPIPRSGVPGDSFSGVCSKGSSDETRTHEIVGTEVLTVAGEEVETLHVRMTASSEGKTRGESVHDIWLLPDSPLVVRREVKHRSVNESAIGDVEYYEEYAVILSSLEARR
jgi:hypothetical protein